MTMGTKSERKTLRTHADVTQQIRFVDESIGRVLVKVTVKCFISQIAYLMSPSYLFLTLFLRESRSKLDLSGIDLCVQALRST